VSEFHFRRITDPVHGTFGLSKLESDIISTSVFQRLHNVKQLGLAHLVYPGAGYSRFSHSVGACHVAGRMMRALNQNGLKQWDAHEIQKYRLAALLHDVGHYPFSHAMEHVLQDHYKAGSFLTGASDGDAVDPVMSKEPPAYDHETLGRQIIEHDAEIEHVLSEHNFTTDEIKGVFSREQPDGLSNLVSSDLDCDRLDYMMRTAHGAGLPYGAVDVEYLTTQMCVDSEGYLCLTRKALRAADHFLVSRYYDYTQVAYHKTVVGLEEVLKDVIAGLIANGLDCSGAAMKAKILDGTFAAFDDQAVVSLMRDLSGSLGNGDLILRRKLHSVLHREAPKLVAASERIGSRESAREHLNNVDQLKRHIPVLARDFSISEELWHLWKAKLNLSKIGSTIPVGDVDGDSFEEELQQVVRILTTKKRDQQSKSKPLIEHDFALLKQLANVRLYAMRLYVHLPEDCKDQAALRTEITKKIRADLPNFPFSD
jgi:HD superfamily phosphohydrolase